MSPAFFVLCKPKDNSMAAFWIFPFDILVRAANPAASAFVAAFIANLHPLSFPLIDFSRTEDGTELIRALSHTHVMVKNS
jgi:hypothetical protein